MVESSPARKPSLLNKIEMAEELIVHNEEFRKNVAIPYLKDIYKDLASQSDQKSKGINRITLLNYSQLPGIIGERLVKVLDINNDEYIDLKEFVHGIFKIIYSTQEQKIKFCFQMYDFDRDDLICREDVRLILSHIPIDSTVNEGYHIPREGIFTMEGGGGHVFIDRLRTQEEIAKLIEAAFKDKQRLTLKDFEKFICEESSEMYLALMVLLTSNLPCSENFTRYKRNFIQYLEKNNSNSKQKQASNTNNSADSTNDASKTGSLSSADFTSIVDAVSQKSGGSMGSNDGEVKTLAAPRIMRSLSPIMRLGFSELNFNPESQKILLKNAASRVQQNEASNFSPTESSPKFKNSAGQLNKKVVNNVSNFKTAKAVQNERKQRTADLIAMQTQNTQEQHLNGDSVRMANMVRKPGLTVITKRESPNSGTGGNSPDQQIQSPSFFLTNGQASPRLRTFNLSEDSPTVQMEGEIIRKASETKLKRYWYTLLGRELYVYKSKTEDKHKSMHSLIGVFIKDEPVEQLDATTQLHPFRLIFPDKRERVYYLLNAEDKQRWVVAIRKAVGYANLFDYYEVKHTLGKGKFGLVKQAVHKKTGKKVAVKVMGKKEMSVSDMELQRREIEILKMCQHPHIIRLLDVFENQDYIYIVMEDLAGGDLFTYLERRQFKIPEKRAKELAHQMTTAVYYLHQFGIAHRDLKPENILMDSDSDSASCKIVDFGLSRIIGPNETSYEPFGTLSYVAPEVLLQKPYGKEVDIWSLGVIMYLLCARVLPFDDEDDKEIARQTIQDQPDFTFHPWPNVSKEGVACVSALLEKNRSKRPTLEQVLNKDWFKDFKEPNNRDLKQVMGKNNQQVDTAANFKRYAQTSPDSIGVQKEIDFVKSIIQ